MMKYILVGWVSMVFTTLNTFAQFELIKTINYEYDVYAFPSDIISITDKTPVILKKDYYLNNTIPQVAEKIEISDAESSTDVAENNEITPQEKPEETKPLPPETYYFRNGAGVLIPVSIAGNIIDFNDSVIFCFEYNLRELYKLKLVNGNFAEERRLTCSDMQEFAYFASYVASDGYIFYKMQTRKDVQSAHIDFYNERFDKIAVFESESWNNFLIKPLNDDTLLIVQYEDGKRDIKLNYYSLKQGIIKSKGYALKSPVYDYFTSCETDEQHNVVLVFNENNGASGLYYFDKDLNIQQTKQFGDYLYYVQLFADTCASLQVFNGSLAFADGKYSILDLRKGKILQSDFLKYLMKIYKGAYTIYMPMAVNRHEHGKYISLLMNAYNSLVTDSNKSYWKLYFFTAEKHYEFSLPDLPEYGYYKMLPLQGKKFAVYKGNVLKEYRFNF